MTEHARIILDLMAPDRRYEPSDLRAFVPHISAEHLREVMHELWIGRQVERVGSGWRRHQSARPDRPDPVRESQAVKPEDLFDYATFADFFK